MKIARSERDLHLKHVPSHSSVPPNEFADVVVAMAARSRWFLVLSRVIPLVT